MSHPRFVVTHPISMCVYGGLLGPTSPLQPSRLDALNLLQSTLTTLRWQIKLYFLINCLFLAGDVVFSFCIASQTNGFICRSGNLVVSKGFSLFIWILCPVRQEDVRPFFDLSVFRFVHSLICSFFNLFVL